MIKKIKKIFPICVFTVFGLCVSSVNAAMDPIKAELTHDFPSTMYISGATYTAIYVFTNQLPFTLAQPLIIEKNADPISEVSYDDRCTGKYLNSYESCQVTIYLTPELTGKKLVQLTEAYGYDRVPVQKLSSTAVALDGNASITGTVTTALTDPLPFSTASSWKFTFHNSGSSQATGVSFVVTGSQGYQTNCGSYINPSDSCYISGTITPTAQGTYTVAATLDYAQGTPVSVSTAASTTSGTGGLSCTPAVPFAPEILISSTAPVTLLCTNKSGKKITFQNTTSGSASLGGGTFSTTIPAGNDANNNCNSAAITTFLASNASCHLTGTYTAPSSAVNNVSISLSVIYNIENGESGLTASTSTSTNVVTTIDDSRTITLNNKCNFTVWWGMVGGAVTGASPSACPSGSTANNGRCLYNGFAPTSGTYELAANTGTATTKIIRTAASTTSDNVLWKGIIAGSTKCSGTSCANNDCGNNGGTTLCTLGFQQPATEAEFTFLLSGSNRVDTYDITQVNGFSIPMSMSTNQTVGSNPYSSCGTAGSTSTQGSSPTLAAASYTTMTPPTNMYYWVSSGGEACASGNTCSDSTTICGLAFSNNVFSRVCGNFLGFWAANQICQTNPNYTSTFGDTFTCAQPLTSPFPYPPTTYTMTQLLKCTPPNTTQPLFNSCYHTTYSSTDNVAQCCGCTNWGSDTGVNTTPNQNCPSGQTDPLWTSDVLPLIKWMKQANPTGYSYPFDDTASTFQCTAASTTTYTITFCPGTPAQTGLPSGKTDGR